MNHLQAIDVGISSKKSYNEIARKVFLSYPTQAFIGDEDREYEILNEVAEQFRVSITSIHVAGSAKLGFSPHKKTSFTPRHSDLDLAIIDAQLFTRYMEFGLDVSRNYTDGSRFPIRDGKSTKQTYVNYLARGIFRPDLMPIGIPRAEWTNFFGVLSKKHSALFRSISAAVYISQSCFESKQRSAISACAETGVI